MFLSFLSSRYSQSAFDYTILFKIILQENLQFVIELAVQLFSAYLTAFSKTPSLLQRKQFLQVIHGVFQQLNYSPSTNAKLMSVISRLPSITIKILCIIHSIGTAFHDAYT